jgi:hypothetical protein
MELTFEKWENGKWYVVLPEYEKGVLKVPNP